MFIRQTLNFTAHFAAGMAMGAFAVIALKAMRENEIRAPEKLSSREGTTAKPPAQD
ncbi:MAG: hypothetical protein R3231_11765 [bacterium]|nr:hypothetical protein [bacterium]